MKRYQSHLSYTFNFPTVLKDVSLIYKSSFSCWTESINFVKSALNKIKITLRFRLHLSWLAFHHQILWIVNIFVLATTPTINSSLALFICGSSSQVMNLVLAQYNSHLLVVKSTQSDSKRKVNPMHTIFLAQASFFGQV